MKTKQAGFSLMECVLVAGFFATICLMAAPMFVRMLNDHHLTAYSNDLVANLNVARRAAVETGRAVSLCASDNGRSCTETPWSQGYILFSDAGEAGVLDGSDQPIKAVAGSHRKIRVTLNGANYVRFLGNGGLVAGLTNSVGESRAPSLLARILDRIVPTAHASSGEFNPVRAPEAVAFLVCSGHAGRTIRLNTIGRVNSTSVACH